MLAIVITFDVYTLVVVNYYEYLDSSKYLFVVDNYS